MQIIMLLKTDGYFPLVAESMVPAANQIPPRIVHVTGYVTPLNYPYKGSNGRVKIMVPQSDKKTRGKGRHNIDNQKFTLAIFTDTID